MPRLEPGLLTPPQSLPPLTPLQVARRSFHKLFFDEFVVELGMDLVRAFALLAALELFHLVVSRVTLEYTREWFVQTHEVLALGNFGLLGLKSAVRILRGIFKP